MKALVCEMCNSHKVVKQDGYYVCQSCDTKYTVEEARKMMIEGTVEVQGTVIVDQQKNLENYLQLAETAVEGNDIETAIKYADKVFEIDPTNYRAWVVRAKTIGWNSSLKDKKVLLSLSAAKKAVEYVPEDKRPALAKELVAHIYVQLQGLYSLASNMCRISYTNGLKEYHDITMLWLKVLKEMPLDKEFLEYEIGLCKRMHDAYRESHYKTEEGYFFSSEANYNNKEPYYMTFRKELLPETVVQEDPQPNKGGCYVATAVYGSYDCPEVWTLRRYRDNTLASTWYGRAFVRTYYAISPTLVKWFGNTNWFKNMWKPTLDKIVNSLNERGVQDTPYNDKRW